MFLFQSWHYKIPYSCRCLPVVLFLQAPLSRHNASNCCLFTMALIHPTHQNKPLLAGCQALTWANMWPLVHISIFVTAPFMTARLHLPIRSNQLLSQSCPTVCGVSSLCQWTVLLPHDYRCDLSHRCPSMRQLSTFLIQTIIAWFSNVLKCKRSELCGNEYFRGLLGASMMLSQRGQCHQTKAFD